jgi:hypothetical protein
MSLRITCTLLEARQYKRVDSIFCYFLRIGASKDTVSTLLRREVPLPPYLVFSEHKIRGLREKTLHVRGSRKRSSFSFLPQVVLCYIDALLAQLTFFLNDGDL